MIFLWIAFSIGCSNLNRINSIDRSLYDKIDQVQPPPYEQSLSTDGAFLLVWVEDSSSGTLMTRYIVWNTKTHDQQYKGSFRGSHITWLDNSHLLVEVVPGIVDESNKNFHYKINVIDKTKTQYTNAFKK